MALRTRFHDQLARERMLRDRLLCISGPRRIGKTAACEALSPHYLDWNDIADRLVLLRGPAAVIQHLALNRARNAATTVAIDNLHGHRNWRPLLRKLNARCSSEVRFVVTTLDAALARSLTGSSLRVHPWSVGECTRTSPSHSPAKPPAPISDEDWAALLEHGGFPEPFEKRDARFTRRWNERCREDLLESDLPQLVPTRDPSIVQMLASLLMSRSATSLVYSELARELGITVDTVRRWMDWLERLQLGFRVRPWFDRVPKAVRKEPRWFLRDWSSVVEPLARARTFMACHLLKAAEGWVDLGFGEFELRYVRDKARREVDFLMLKGRRPWFLVTVSNTDIVDRLAMDEASRPTSALAHFQSCTRARHAFHVVMGRPYIAMDCFEHAAPAAVPARTLLSQLL